MTVAEIFAKINAHMITGIMLHDQMAEYYDFLDLHGFKRCHEYHALSEFAERRGLMRYYINHYNALLPETEVTDPDVIPASWRGYKRTDVDPATKKRAIRDGFARWRMWEADTKKLYQESYSELCEIGEIAAACKVKQLVEAVDMELKAVDRKMIELYSIDYDLSAVYLCQDETHEKYAEKEKHIGVDIC